MKFDKYYCECCCYSMAKGFILAMIIAVLVFMMLWTVKPFMWADNPKLFCPEKMESR